MKAGIHLANDGNVTPEYLHLIENIRLVKGLVRLDCDWDEIDWPRLAAHLRDDCAVVLRLFFPGRLEAGEFVARAARKLPPVLTSLGDRETFIEIHNEPNHCDGIEGWGKEDAQALDFMAWYLEVRHGLAKAGFHNLGFPGLAVGQWAHHERTWAKLCKPAIRASSWLGVHCYWQTVDQIEHLALGANWRWYRREFPKKRIIVTEAGNSGCHGPMGPPLPPEQAAQYARWCELARDDVYGVAFYMLGGSEDWRGFEIYPETVRALEGI